VGDDRAGLALGHRPRAAHPATAGRRRRRPDIARKLGTGWGTSLGTVKADKTRLYAKLGARTAAHAVHLAHEYGLLAADAMAGGAR
jgi:hypothetical protein